MPELVPDWWVWLTGLMITTEGIASGCVRLTIRPTFMAHAIETSALTIASSYLIKQDWDAYSPEQHAVWAELVNRQMPALREHACQEYLDGFETIGLRNDCIPNLAQVSQRLEPRTGWNSTPVSGFLPADAFFEMLAARRFPTTTWLRSRESLEYTPEPDIFHDVFGHVPMHAHPVFADFLQQYGKVCAGLRDMDALERMGRLFWFTVEFGVIRQEGKLKIYGSGLISSHGEANYVLKAASGGGPEIRDFNLDQVLEQEFLVSEMQKVLYAIDSFEQIYEAAQEAERRLHG
jgi:phenylalanine-4-hydroxylase